MGAWVHQRTHQAPQADGICSEKWCDDLETLRNKTRADRSRQDKYFARLAQSVLGKMELDTPESYVMQTDSPCLVRQIYPHHCFTASLHHCITDHLLIYGSLRSSLKRARQLMETSASTGVDSTETVEKVDSAARQTSGDPGPSKAASDNDVDLEALLTSLKLSDDADSSGKDEGEAGRLVDEDQGEADIFTEEERGEAGRLMDELASMRSAEGSEGESEGGDQEGRTWYH